jgi:hypothetical protein
VRLFLGQDQGFTDVGKEATMQKIVIRKLDKIETTCECKCGCGCDA